MEIIFIGIAVILGIWLLFHAAIYLWVLFEEYVLPILIFCGVGSFFFWLIFWIFGIKEIFGISTMIIGAVIGFYSMDMDNVFLATMGDIAIMNMKIWIMTCRFM